MFDCCGSGSVCCSRLRPEAHQKQPQKQPFPLRGEVGGAFSSQQWLFSGPCTRSSDLQRGTRQSKLLEILQTCRAPLGWQHSPPAQLGFERMTFATVCGIFWSLHQKKKAFGVALVASEDPARLARCWQASPPLHWQQLRLSSLETGFFLASPRLTRNGPPYRSVHHRTGITYQSARRWISQSWEGPKKACVLILWNSTYLAKLSFPWSETPLELTLRMNGDVL